MLDGSNYEDWRRSVQSTLTVVDAFDIVSGEEQQLPAANGAAAKAAILTRFLNTHPEPEERVGVYIAGLQTYQTQLHGTEDAISDGLLKSRIYETVPSQFKSLVTILRDTKYYDRNDNR